MNLAEANGSWDIFIYAFFFMAVFVYGVAIRKEMSVIMIIATFVSVGITYLLTAELDGEGNRILDFDISSDGLFNVRALLFAIFVFGVSYFLIANKFLSGMVSAQSEGKWWLVERALFGLAFSGLFVSSIMMFMSQENRTILMEKTGDRVQWALLGKGVSLWVISPFLLLWGFGRGE